MRGRTPEQERRFAKLNDEDHRVNTAVKLGGVKRQLKDVRGIIVESFKLGDEDVTQIITRLERAGCFGRTDIPWNLSPVNIKRMTRQITTKIGFKP
jgi:hypothetical protein